MAIRVPQADPGQVTRQQGLPNVRLQNVPGPAAFANNNLINAANAVEHGAMTMSRVLLEAQQRETDDANRTRVNDALIQLAQYDQDAAFADNGWRNVLGKDALSRQSSKPLPDEVMEARQARIGSLMAELGNDAQRAAFSEHAAQSGVRLRGELLGHEAEQVRTYKREVLINGMDTAAREATLYYNDTDRLREQFAAIERYAQDLGYLEHGSEEIGRVNSVNRVGKALNAAIDASLTNGDTASATRLLQQFGAKMDANDFLKATQLVNGEHDRRTALNIGTEVLGELYPKMQTGDADRAFNILIGAESGGRQLDDSGAPLTSRAGAIGIAQILPSTGPEAAKLAGLPWDEQRFRTDATYNRALGRAYFNKQLTRFGGDVEKAWAAYNAGPGAVSSALELAQSTGLYWKGFLPDETQAYVAKNLKALAAGKGKEPLPTLADAQRLALEKIGPNASAELQKNTLAVVEKTFEEQSKAIKQRNEDATAEAMSTILANGGGWEDLPATVRAAVPTDDVTKVMDFAAKLRKGQDVETDYGLWYELKSNPGLLRDTNLMAFRNRLSDGEFKQLADEQQKVRSGDVSHFTSVRSPKAVLDQLMMEAGIDPTPKADDKTGAQQVGRIWSAFENSIKAAETEKGNKLDSDEMRRVAAKLFTQVPVDRRYWFGSTSKPAALLEPGDALVIPAADRQQIINALRTQRPNQPITEGDIKALYARRLGLL